MRRIFEWIGGFALIAFSFYFTDRVSILVANKSDLMQEIKTVSKSYEVEAENAQIDEKANTIIPGKFGKTVNSEESYLEMHDFGSFNENYLVFDYIKPSKSLEDNKDKFITGGNPKNRRISIILEKNEIVEKYLDENKISYNILLEEYSNIKDNVEIINIAPTKEKFNEIDKKIKTSKICIKDRSTIELCMKKAYYLVDPKISLNSTNLIDVKNNIAPGSIILITSSARLEDIKLILNEIEYKDLEIVNISKLIDEKESKS